MTTSAGRATPRRATVGLIPWGQVIEDFLDGIGVTLDEFASTMSGGWLFGYVDALATAGVSTVLLCVSRQVTRPLRRVHAPTGAALWLLPAAAPWRVARRLVATPYAWSAADAVPVGAGRTTRSLALGAHHLLPWLATPPIALARAVRAERVDVLLCQEYEDARFDVALAIGRLLHVPVCATFQGGDRSRTPLERTTRRVAVRSAARLVIGSPGEATRVRRAYDVAPERIAPVPNPVSLDAWPALDRATARRRLGIAPDADVVAWHGRVDYRRKGLDVLLDAWDLLPGTKDRPRLLLLVGDGPDAGVLEARIARAAPVVRWHPHYVLDRTIVRDHLAAADVAVLPSRHEGFAVAVLESLASARAVVATSVPGIEAVAPRGEHDGVVVVAPGDPTALASGMASLLADKPRADAMGRAGRDRIREAFSPEAVGAGLAAALVPTGASAGTAGRRLA